MKKFFRCHSRITIQRHSFLRPEHKKPVLLIIKKNPLHGRNGNIVCISGNNCDVLFELFELKGTHLVPTELGKRFGAVLKTNSKRIDITHHHRLKDLCKALQLKKVIITRSYPF